MNQSLLRLLNDVNGAIIKIRGLYSSWSLAQGISYNEMLVLYTIREHGFCTQKQICDSYLLPRQTMNNVIAGMQKSGLLALSPKDCRGREKAFVLTAAGKEKLQPVIASLNDFESKAIHLLGDEKLRTLADLMLAYGQVLHTALGEER